MNVRRPTGRIFPLHRGKKSGITWLQACYVWLNFGRNHLVLICITFRATSCSSSIQRFGSSNRASHICSIQTWFIPSFYEPFFRTVIDFLHFGFDVVFNFLQVTNNNFFVMLRREKKEKKRQDRNLFS